MDIKSFILIDVGKNNWKRYLLSSVTLFIITVLGWLLYQYVLSLYVKLDGDPNSFYDENEMIGINLNPTYHFVILNILYVITIVGFALIMLLIHKRKFLTLLTPNDKLNLKKIFWGFGLFLCLLFGKLAIIYLFNPYSILLNHVPFKEFLYLFLFVILLKPLQTLAEVILIRSYSLQWFGRKIKSPLLLSIIVGIILGLLNFAGTDMVYSPYINASYYITVEIIFCYITCKTNSAELIFGAQTANFMFGSLFMQLKNSSFEDVSAIFTINNNTSLISFLVCDSLILIVFVFLSIKKYGEFKQGESFSINEENLDEN